MAVKEIKTRFKLEGEQQFKKTMTESAAAVKVLNSEEKLAEAQFKATGDAQTYAAEKSRILKEQIAQQQKAGEAAEKAVQDLTKNGVQPNAREMQTWQTKLFNAKTNLANMQTKLNAVEGELGEQKTAVMGAKDETEKYNSEIGKVAQGVNLQNTITAIDNLKGHIEGIVKKAAQAAKAIWQMGVDAGSWADNVATESAKLGVDAETYQSWQYASRLIDTSVQDISKSWGDIGKKLKEAEDETIKVGVAGKEVSVRVAQSSRDYKDAVTDQTQAAKEAAKANEESSKAAEDYKKVLRELGVSVTDVTTGKVRPSNEIFWDAIDALHGITDAAELEHKATLVFGNDWRNLQPLITAGAAAYKDLAEEGKNLGAVLSNDEVAQLGGFDDTMQKVEAQAEALKNKLMAGLSPTFQTVAQALSDANKALSDFLASEEGQAALASLNEALSGIIKSFLGEDGGQGTFESIVTGAKDAVEKLTTALDWISQHGEVVSGIITGMGAAWAGLTVTKEVLLFMQLLKATPLSKLSTLFNRGAGAAANAGSNAVRTAATAVGSSAKHAMLGNFASALVPAAVFAAGTLPAHFMNEADRETSRQYTAETTARAVEAAEGLGEKADNFVQMITQAAQALGTAGDKDVFGFDKITDPAKVTAALKKAYEMNFGDVLDDATNQMLERFWKSQTDASVEGLSMQDEQALLQSITNQLQAGLDAMKTAGQDAAQGLADGMTENTAPVETSAKDVADAMIKSVKTTLDEHSPSAVMADIGANASIGLANGINSRAGDAIRAAQSLANRVTAIMRQALQIHSPSKVFEELGAFTGEGFALGLEQSAARVNRAAGRMLGAVSGASRITPAGYAEPGWSYGTPAGRTGLSGAAGAVPDKVHVTLMLDKDVLADTMVPLVDAEMGAKIQATRR